MQITLNDPPLNEGVPVFGNVVSGTEFQGVLTHGLFKMIVPDPRRLEGHLAKYNPDLQGVAAMRRRVQRLVTGAKRSNVLPYARYMIETAKTDAGFTPQIVLWCKQPLQVEVDKNTGFAWALIPHELKFVALDGDTQTAARNMADELEPELFSKGRIKVVIRHSTPDSVAEQIFADCNSKGVKVTTSMAIGLDTRDDATQLAKYVEASVAALKGKVNRQKRQLGSSDGELVTMSALRASVVCLVQGIGGVQNQTKAVDIEEDRLETFRKAAVAWYSSVVDALNGALQREQRGKTFAASPSVWCAIGALGHEVLRELMGDSLSNPVTPGAIEHAFKAAAEAKLAGVDWSRGSHWFKFGAKESHSGAVTLGGPKETGSLVYKALTERSLVKQTQAAE